MIPDYQACMLPLLKFASDQKIHTLPEAVERIAVLFNLTEEEKQQLLPSGTQTVIFNRVGWARTYLKKSAYLKIPKEPPSKLLKEAWSYLMKNLLR